MEWILDAIGLMGAIIMTVIASTVTGWCILARYNDFAIRVLAIAVTVFQIAHFTEHAVQVLMWMRSPVDIAYTSLPANLTQRGFAIILDLLELDGNLKSGMEILHLQGNWIFFCGLICWMRLYGHLKLVRYTFYLQGFHVVEHISLTVTKLLIDNPIGVSTLFGSASDFSWYRVWWHFIMNLVATLMICKVWYDETHERLPIGSGSSFTRGEARDYQG